MRECKILTDADGDVYYTSPALVLELLLIKSREFWFKVNLEVGLTFLKFCTACFRNSNMLFFHKL